MGVVSGTMLAKQTGWHEVRFLGYGGIAYSLGAIFEYFQPPFFIPWVFGPHEVFHVAIILGAYFHWTFIEQHSALQSNNLPLIENE